MLSKAFTNKNSSQAVLCAADVIAIIQACKDSNVKSLVFGGLTLDLGEPQAKEEPLFIPQYENQRPSQEAPQKEDVLNELSKLQSLITDPAAYEKSQIGLLE